MADEAEAPWSVEIPQSQVSFLLGPSGATLKRLVAATGCEIEVARQPKKKLRKISYGGQDQYLEDEAGDDASRLVKVFIRGVAKKRAVAATVLRAVADGDDPEDHAAMAEGAVVVPHDLQHPDREAWARWRLAATAHEHGARAHVGRRTIRLAAKSGLAFSEDAAHRVKAAVDDVLSQAKELVEVKVEARDELEPEEAPSDLAVLPFVDQYGVIVRVCDQDDNAVSETITVRLFGPPGPTEDCAAALRARFVEGLATSILLQPLGEVQDMEEQKAKDYAGDLTQLEAELQVKVQMSRTALRIEGADDERVAEARGTLQEMLQFYMPSSFHLATGLTSDAVQRLLADEDLGVLMARGDAVVSIDENARAAWVCGSHRPAVQRCIDAAMRAPPTAMAALEDAGAEGSRPAKR
eukprot:CAMPEP_0176148152 /NCGR_PEP_ID=MMETSP0120_2-20121206/75540_1 /TAXON_ID=160619 /ORGANISM="Kryptoperidinium foliaceum, Strain CCMP 1326" /LENGTH=409 /DNA_ID=CAMNT_0017484813 /DNA_START=20 /DNA_END=1246 /DNA_ORIENTATION=-